MTPGALLSGAMAEEGDATSPHGGRSPLAQLLAAARLQADEEVRTCSIGYEGRELVIRWNPGFCARHVRSTADAQLLLGHELHHSLLGHLELEPAPEPWTGLQNLALDILVNSAASRRFVQGEPGLLRMYRFDRFPECLLRPPSQLIPPTTARGRIGRRARWPDVAERAAAEHLRGLGVIFADAFARLWADGWFGSPEAEGYWRRARSLFRAEFGPPPPTRWLPLGSHEPGRRSGGTAAGLGRHGTFGTQGWATPVRVRRSERHAERLRTFVESLREAVDDTVEAHLPRYRTASSRAVVPAPGRREIPLLALGCPPAHYLRRLPRQETAREGVHLYVDVSGSTHRDQAVYLELARQLGTRLVLPAWAWSLGAPRPIHCDDLEAGRVKTCGGTDLLPVLRHARERGFKRIVVLTDGEFHLSVGARECLRENLSCWFVLRRHHPKRIARLRTPETTVLTLPGGL